MKEIPQRTGKGYEIQLYYGKEMGKCTEKTGNENKVIACENVGEVAQWFARNTWSSGLYEDSNLARPTVWLDGKPWCRYEYSEVK